MTRMTIGLLVVGALSVSMTVVDAAPAAACSCVTSTDREAFRRADAVFVGAVTDYQAPTEARSSVAPAVWTFAVDQVLKGEVTRSQQIVSEVSGVSCGLEIAGRGEFLVFATVRTYEPSPAPRAGQYYAGLCGGTRAVEAGGLEPGLARSRAPVDARARSRVATPAVAPRDSSSSGWPVVLLGASVATAIGLGLVVLRTVNDVPTFMARPDEAFISS